MSYSLFISDLHLCTSKPKVINAFLKFLNTEVIHSDALYILGDLFEKWIGDDDNQLLHNLTAKSLFSLKKKGIKCYFIYGNRDFLLSDKFIIKSGIIVLPEKLTINIYGKKILILHGDTLCIDDIKYQLFRKIMKKLWIKNIFLFLPLFLRKNIVNIFYKKNKKINLKKQINVNKKEIIRIIKKYKVKFIIHGHTHKESIHIIKIKNTLVKRFVLNNWKKKGSFIKISKNKILLNSFYL